MSLALRQPVGTPFTYAIAITHFVGDVAAETAAWRAETLFDARVRANLVFLPLESMLAEVLETIGTTPAATQFGRLLQVVKAAGYEFKKSR